MCAQDVPAKVLVKARVTPIGNIVRTDQPTADRVGLTSYYGADHQPGEIYQMPLQRLEKAIIDGDAEAAVELVEEALSAGTDANEILENGLTKGMRQVGNLFEAGEYFVPEMLVAAEAMGKATDVLRPHLVSGSFQNKGKVVIGTVEGDLHDIGKRLVAMMLEGTGFEVIDLGTSVPPSTFAKAVQDSRAELVAVSALLTTTLPAMEETIRLIRGLDQTPPPKIMVGGAPINEDFADRIGADGYAPDAARGAKLAESLVS